MATPHLSLSWCFFFFRSCLEFASLSPTPRPKALWGTRTWERCYHQTPSPPSGRRHLVAGLTSLSSFFLPQIWVHSAHNGSGYYSGYGEEVLQSDHFNSRLSFGDTQTVWARTGYLGFLRRTELTDANGG